MNKPAYLRTPECQDTTCRGPLVTEWRDGPCPAGVLCCAACGAFWECTEAEIAQSKAADRAWDREQDMQGQRSKDNSLRARLAAAPKWTPA